MNEPNVEKNGWPHLTHPSLSAIADNVFFSHSPFHSVLSRPVLLAVRQLLMVRASPDSFRLTDNIPISNQNCPILVLFQLSFVL